MSEIAALLQPLKDRLAAATPGPWEVADDPLSDGDWMVRQIDYEPDTPDDVAAAIGHESTAEFIAHAPTDQAKLIAVIEAVAARHQESFRKVEPWAMGYKYSGHHCVEDGEAWPCDTIAALTQALGGDGA